MKCAKHGLADHWDGQCGALPTVESDATSDTDELPMHSGCACRSREHDAGCAKGSTPSNGGDAPEAPPAAVFEVPRVGRCSDVEPTCERCGGDVEWVDCWQCGGEKLHGHDCGEDTCMCLDKGDNVKCDACEGVGGWSKCAAPCIAPCPVCKDRAPKPEQNYGGGYDVVCGNCFDADCVGDPPEYVTSCITASGGTKAEAIEDWNWKVSEYEPRVKGGR